MKRRLSYRRNRGYAAALAFVGCVPLICAIGGVSVDSMHFNDARGALQRATDASALTGMEYISQWAGNKSNGPSSTSSNKNEVPVNYGLSIASMNGVDGNGLYDNTAAKRTVAVELVSDPTKSGYVAGGRPNTCVATGQVYIRSIFSQFFGNYGQTVNTRSVAGMVALNKVNAYAPMLVSWTDPDPDGKTLINTPMGQQYTIIIKDMGDKESNAIWIENSASTMEDYILYLAGLGPRPSTDKIPNYAIGDTIKASNGQGPGKSLDKLNGLDLPFLITDDNGTGLTAKGKPEHIITRIVGMKDLKVTDNKGGSGFRITGTLYPIVVNGSNDPNGQPNNVPSGSIPYMVRLIQ